MIKNILNLKGVKILERKNQSLIRGNGFLTAGLNNCFRFCQNNNDCAECGPLFSCKEGIYGGICELN